MWEISRSAKRSDIRSRLRSNNIRGTALILIMVLAVAGLEAFFAGAGKSVLAVFDSSQPAVGQGIPAVGSNAPRSAAASTKPGSILFFPKFISDQARQSEINTLLTLTNVNPKDGVNVRLFFVSGCEIRDFYLSLVANQSRTLVAGDEFPGRSGFVIAIAVNAQGLPTQFNWLIGQGSLRDEQGHEAAYNAFGVARRAAGPVSYNHGTLSADVVFDGVEYDRLPGVVALDSLQNQDPTGGPAYRTDISILSPPADLSGQSPNIFRLKSTLYDFNGMPVEQDLEASCHYDGGVAGIWTESVFNSVIGVNRPGWASFSVSSEQGGLPVIGLSLTDGLEETLHSARMMQSLQWLESFRMTVPVGIPGNPIADSVTEDLPESTGGANGMSETRAGSILLYPRFTSGIYGATRIYLTNTNPTEKVKVRLFFSGLVGNPEVKEAIFMVPAQQTLTIDPDQIAPDQKGWLMAVAISAGSLPVAFNHLIGSAQVLEATGQKASFNAMAIGKNSPGVVSRNDDVLTADLVFDDLNYDRLPATVAMSFVPSQFDNSSLLGFSRASGSLLDPPNSRGAASVVLIDDMLSSFGANIPRTETRLNQIRASILQPPITNSIQPGRHGWLRLYSSTPLIAWTLNMATKPFMSAGNGNWSGGLSGDGNLHLLTLAETFTIRIPAINPNNNPPVASAEIIGQQVEARRSDGTIVRLDGRTSNDPDPDDSLAYEWFDNHVPVSTARVADRRLGLGAHKISLVVTDGSEISGLPAEQTVSVVDTKPPQISGIPSAVTVITDAEAGAAVTFAMPIAYDMVDGNVTVTSSKQSGSVFPIGKTTVDFIAADAAGNVATASMDVTVSRGAPQPQTGGEAGDKAPRIDNLNDQYVKPGEIRNILLRGEDPDGDPLTFELAGEPSYAQILNGDPISRIATLRIAPQNDETAISTNVRVVVRDGRGEQFTTLPFRIMVSEIPNDETGSGVSRNHAPQAVIAPIPPVVQATSKAGAQITLDAGGSFDEDGDPIGFAWYDGDILIGKTAVIDTELAVGSHLIKLVLFDGKDGLTTVGPLTVDVLPRDLSLLSSSPNRLDRPSTLTLTIAGTGFNPATEVRFTKEGVSIVNLVSIEEDQIVVNIAVSETAVPGFRDIYVINPNGKSARLRSGLFVNP